MDFSVMVVFILMVLATTAMLGVLYARSRSKAHPNPDPEPIPDSQKKIEISIGLAGWYLVNGLIWFWVSPSPVNGSGYSALFSFIMIPANILVLLVCALIPRLRNVALGILIALALNLFISLLLGMVANALCFIPFFHK